MPAGAPGRASEAVSKREQSNSSETKYDYMFEGLYTEIFKELNDELTMWTAILYLSTILTFEKEMWYFIPI